MLKQLLARQLSVLHPAALNLLTQGRWVPHLLSVTSSISSRTISSSSGCSGDGASSSGSGGGPESGDAQTAPPAANYALPKQRDKPALSQKVKFVDRLVVEVAGGSGGGGSSALFGRTGGPSVADWLRAACSCSHLHQRTL
jgi:hypothetical protein